jgi:dipeptidyl aminopeptidase/acylaminoacyl peptidase
MRGTADRLIWRVAAAGAALSISNGAAVGQQRFTLEQVMSAPFGTELVAAPTGGRVAWVQNILGVRNIWLADPPDYRGRQVTHYTVDEGQRVAQLDVTPDGNAIFYVRGGKETGARTPFAPNPANLPTGTREEIWMVLTTGAEPPVRVAEGQYPVVSPRGDLVAYLQERQIWGVPLGRTDGAHGKPEMLVLDRGNPVSLRWSPSGDRLAFVSRRGAYSFVGVYDVDARSLAYVDASIDRDRDPVWSPDGSRLAFIREAAATGDPPFAPRREAHPWSIRVVDVATGVGREVWRAKEGVGSAFWNLLSNARQLFWGAGDRLIFPWERTGWVHLYSVSVDGGEAVELTPGEFEVEHTTLSPDGQEIVFSSNQGDINRRHLWRVSVAAGPPQALTSGRGIEYWPVITSDGAAMAFMVSGSKVPPRVELGRLGGLRSRKLRAEERQVLVPGVAPEGFPADALVEPESVVFSATDGVRIHGQLFLPPDHRPTARHPAVIYLHGGPRAQMVLGYHYPRLDYYQKMYGLIQYLASRGYIVLSVNYRSGTGYGMAFREAKEYGSGGASQARDVIGGGLYLQNRRDVDPERIGIWGGSYGGYLTAMGLGLASDLFAAGVDIHGVHSFGARFRYSPYVLADQDEILRVARQSSPLSLLDRWRSPVLFIHGDDDQNVPFIQTVALASGLRRRGVEIEQLVFPNDVHSFLLHENWVRAFRAAADFFDRKLARHGDATIRHGSATGDGVATSGRPRHRQGRAGHR